MTDKNKEIIVKLVAEGKNSYADFCKVIPDLKDFHIIGITSVSSYNPNGTLLQKTHGNKYSKTVKPTDRFTLNERGLNLLFQIQKEEKIESTNKLSLSLAKDAVTYAKKAYIATVIIGAVTIALSVIMLCLALR